MCKVLVKLASRLSKWCYVMTVTKSTAKNDTSPIMKVSLWVRVTL